LNVKAVSMMKKMLLASVAALAVQPVVFLIWMGLPYAFTPDDFPWNEFPDMAKAVTIFALPHLFLLGIPAFLIMKRNGWLSAARIALAGFLIGMLFPMIIGWPRDEPGSVLRRVDTFMARTAISWSMESPRYMAGSRMRSQS